MTVNGSNQIEKRVDFFIFFLPYFFDISHVQQSFINAMNDLEDGIDSSCFVDFFQGGIVSLMFYYAKTHAATHTESGQLH
jgi:hypothetical protein